MTEPTPLQDLLDDARAALRRGDVAAAARASRQVLGQSPLVPEALGLFAMAVALAGESRDAVAMLRLALALRPDDAAVMNALSCALRDAGDADAACAMAERALAAQPERPEFLRSLAKALTAARRLPEAGRAYARLAALPGYEPQDAHNRCVLLHQTGSMAEAETVGRQTAERWPDNAGAWFTWGLMATYAGKPRDGVAAYRRVLELKPDHMEARLNLSTLFRRHGNPEECARLCRDILAGGNPDYRRGAYINLGQALSAFGDARGSLDAYAAAEALAADPVIGSNKVYACSYLDDISNRALFDAHLDWTARYAAPVAPLPPRRPRPEDSGRRLRVGYVSPDFRGHSCYFFLAPLYQHHDPAAVEIFSYSAVDQPDRFTEEFKAASSQWRDIRRSPDDEVAAMIRRDGIDILVDLAGHTAGNRLLVFARKPAPVQVTWLGYPTTTGLEAVDWRLSDRWLTPPDSTEVFSERLFRLDRVSHCYRLIDEMVPPVAPLPCERNGHITFGSFNNFAKLSDASLRLWADALRAVPGSRLRLKSRYLGSREATDTLVSRFAAAGGDAARLDVTGGHERVQDHLLQYNDVDIALDTCPYGGMTTTCEALAMGVPVVTLAGERTSARYAYAVLAALGLEDLAAHRTEDFAAIAARLGADRARLAALRSGLRQRMLASPLCDGPGFARAVEDAYRRMWAEWCGTPRQPG